MKCHRQTQDRENVNQTCIDIKKYLVLCLVPNKLMMQCTTLNSEQFQEIIFCENYLIVRPATTFNFFFCNKRNHGAEHNISPSEIYQTGQRIRLDEWTAYFIGL